MILSKKALSKIKKIIDNNYKSLLINVAGNSVLSEDELAELKRHGLDVSNQDSLLSLIYYNNVINDLSSDMGPTSIPEMKRQQKGRPEAPLHSSIEESLNENLAQVTKKLSADVQARVEGLIREYNFVHRNKTIQSDSEATSALMKESSSAGLKAALRELSEKVEGDWDRIATTETSNALGVGSVDRIVVSNSDKDLDEVYVYRIPINDSRLCKFCRKFYLDADESPAVYKLSTILANGSNYGKKSIDWKPVASATHVHERCSGILELRPGWKVTPGGKVDFIGYDSWKDYISKKIRG